MGAVPQLPRWQIRIYDVLEWLGYDPHARCCQARERVRGLWRWWRWGR